MDNLQSIYLEYTKYESLSQWHHSQVTCKKVKKFQEDPTIKHLVYLNPSGDFLTLPFLVKEI